MASASLNTRPLSSLFYLCRSRRSANLCIRCLSTAAEPSSSSSRLPPPLQVRTALSQRPRSPYRILHDPPYENPKKIRTYPPPPSAAKTHPFPLLSHQESQITLLDPSNSRTRLFDRSNPDCPRVGDILHTTFKTGDPFSGVCMNIRRQGVDTAVLLRNKLMGVSVEMWVKIYSPNVRSLEVVKRAERRARRARLYYLRNKKHDPPSVEGVVSEYLRRRRMLRSGAGGGARGSERVGMKGGKKSASTK